MPLFVKINLIFTKAKNALNHKQFFKPKQDGKELIMVTIQLPQLLLIVGFTIFYMSRPVDYVLQIQLPN